jgi:hypothetical protein
VVLYSLLDDHGLGVLLLVSLGVEGKRRTIQNSFFTITKSVVCWVEFPVVISLFLLSWSVISVSFTIHGSGVWIISNKRSSLWIKHLFSTFQSLTWNSEFHSLFTTLSLNMLWPFILSTEPFSKWFSIMRCIFGFFYIIKFIR